MRPTQIHLDRLQKALAAQGFRASRGKALEIVAAAFGYHNSNEFTAASKRGDVTPPPAEYVGTIELDDTSMVVLRDPTSKATYAIEEAFVDGVIEDERAERFGITPYGHMVDLSQVAGAEPRTIATKGTTRETTYVATISHRHGTNTYVDPTREGLYRQLREYCDEWWHEVEDKVEIDLETATDEEVVDAYFEENADEFLETDTACPSTTNDRERSATDPGSTRETTANDGIARLLDGLTIENLRLVKAAAEDIGWNLSHHLPVEPLHLTLDQALMLGALLTRIQQAKKGAEAAIAA